MAASTTTRRTLRRLRRRARAWTKRAYLPEKTDPYYTGLIASPWGRAMAKRTQGKFVLDRIGGKDHDTMRGEFIAKKNELNTDIQEGIGVLSKIPFQPRETRWVHAAMQNEIRRTTDHVFGKGKSIVIQLVSKDRPEQTISIHDLIETTHSPGRVFRVAGRLDEAYHGFPGNETNATFYKTLRDRLARLYLTVLILRDFGAHEIRSSPRMVERSFRRMAPLAGFDELNNHGTLESIRHAVEMDFLRQKRLDRKAVESNEQNEFIRHKRWKMRLRRVLSQFVIPREKRKEIAATFTERMETRKGYKGKSSTPTRPLRRAANDAFKASRYYLRLELQKLNYNADEIFEKLKLNREQSGSGFRDYSTSHMRRIQEFARAFFSKKSREERAALVQSILKKYANENGDNPSSSVPGPLKIDEHINPKKAAKRAMRAAKRKFTAMDEKRPDVMPAERLPDELPTILSRMSEMHRIRPEWKGHLYKRISSMRLEKGNEEQIKAGLKELILIKMGTDVKGAGRISARALRNFTIPEKFHGLYQVALRELMHDGILEYQTHVGSSNWVGLTRGAVHKVIAKYDIRHT
ncbi:MAG: hypothetical protein AABX02_05435 [archaeon]